MARFTVRFLMCERPEKLAMCREVAKAAGRLRKVGRYVGGDGACGGCLVINPQTWLCSNPLVRGLYMINIANRTKRNLQCERGVYLISGF